jgi:hypothetical protein
MGCDDATCLAKDTTAAIAQTPGGAAKFVFGLASGNRAPSPEVALTYLKSSLVGKIAGMFSYDAEDDLTTDPIYCLEDVGRYVCNHITCVLVIHKNTPLAHTRASIVDMNNSRPTAPALTIYLAMSFACAR